MSIWGKVGAKLEKLVLMFSHGWWMSLLPSCHLWGDSSDWGGFLPRTTLSLNSLLGDAQLYSLDFYLAWDKSVGYPVPRLNNRNSVIAFETCYGRCWKISNSPTQLPRTGAVLTKTQILKKTHLYRGLKYSFWHRHTGKIRFWFSKPAAYKTLNSPPGLSPLTMERNVKN